MRRRPSNWYLPDVPLAPVPLRSGYEHEPGLRNQRPQDQGDRVRPWYASGGACAFFNPFTGTFYDDSARDGVQLVASSYIGQGMTGFLKDFSVAPFKPAFLAGGMPSGSGLVEAVTGASVSGVVDPKELHPDSNTGVWQTPFGWECYRVDAQAPTLWKWHLRFIPGRLEDVRRQLNIPPFSALDPSSWYLLPNLPVPRAGYSNGIPGSPAGEPWSGQRVQRVAPFLTHGPVQVIVPSDTTVCLFAAWEQDAYRYQTSNVTDLTNVTVEGLAPALGLFVLGPSFGQMNGYTQPNNRTATQEAARKWFA